MLVADNVSITIVGVATKTAMLSTNLPKMEPRERTQILELCLVRALEWFWTNYGPLRFTGYAKAELGYEVLPSTYKRKRSQSRHFPDATLPNVFTGATRDAAKNMWRVETKTKGGAKSSMAQGKIVLSNIPGYAAGPSRVTGKVLTKISAREGGYICDRFFAEVLSASERMSESVTTRNGKFIPRSTAGQSDANQYGRASRATFVAMRSTGGSNA
jgi:hypothetical protein